MLIFLKKFVLSELLLVFDKNLMTSAPGAEKSRKKNFRKIWAAWRRNFASWRENSAFQKIECV
jgi:hypothetical protein